MNDARRRGWVSGMVGASLLIAAALVVGRQIDSNLLRSDPNSLPTRPRLMGIAVQEGAWTYRAHCASCHGAGGHGDRARGVPDLTDGDWLYGSGRVSEVEQVIDFGIRAHNPRSLDLAEMPAFARPVPSVKEPKIPPLAPGEIRDVVEYLRFVEGKPAARDAVQWGSALYHERGGCYDCHGQDGSGDTAIGAPNLTDNIWLYGDGSRESMFNSIARGHSGVCPAWIGKLSPAAMRKTALFVYSLSHSRQSASSKSS